jgi:hypothetical protein
VTDPVVPSVPVEPPPEPLSEKQAAKFLHRRHFQALTEAGYSIVPTASLAPVSRPPEGPERLSEEEQKAIAEADAKVVAKLLTIIDRIDAEPGPAHEPWCSGGFVGSCVCDEVHQHTCECGLFLPVEPGRAEGTQQ